MTLVASYRAGLPRRWWPLLVSLAVHTLLIVLWVRHPDLRPAAVETPEPLSVMLVPTRPAPPLVPTQPGTVRHKRKEETQAPRPAAAAADLPLPSPAPAPQPAAPAEIQPAAPAQPSAAQILEDSRHDIGHMGRELGAKDGVSPLRARPAPPSLKPSGKWSRFAQQLDDAHIDRAPGVVLEEYTSPDGRILYRRKEGGRVICRQSGSTGPPATWRSEEAVRAGAGRKSTLGLGSSAGDVLCPDSDRDWKKD